MAEKIMDSKNSNKNKRINVFKNCLKQQCELHGAMAPADVVKLCFQAAYGAEHLLSDLVAARKFFDREYERTEPAEGPLCEQIAEQIFRVNLAVWKQKGLPREWLFSMFAASVNQGTTDEDLFSDYLKAAEEILFIHDNCGFSQEEWCRYLEKYCSKAPEAVHHSDRYREKEQPAYRIVRGEYIRFLSILEEIAKVRASKSPFVIAIDGRAAAGKTTLAAALQEILQASVIHMDDFFLPMELRSADRFREPGGNVHYERFKEEVLPYLKENSSFSYRIFDCSCMNFHGAALVDTGEWRIVEGSYSMHPKYGTYADIAIFCDVEPEKQMERIKKRNGVQMAEMFRTRWIPLEETYFEAYSVKEKADCVMEA